MACGHYLKGQPKIQEKFAFVNLEKRDTSPGAFKGNDLSKNYLVEKYSQS